MQVAIEVAAARGAGQDRATVLTRGDGVVIALADGAGGTGNGARAAQARATGERRDERCK